MRKLLSLAAPVACAGALFVCAHAARAGGGREWRRRCQKLGLTKAALLPQIVEKSLNSRRCLLTRALVSCKKSWSFEATVALNLLL